MTIAIASDIHGEIRRLERLALEIEKERVPCSLGLRESGSYIFFHTEDNFIERRETS